MFEAMQGQINDLTTQVQGQKNLIEELGGTKPESLRQLVVSQRNSGSPTAGGTIRVVTTQGEVNLLIE